MQSADQFRDRTIHFLEWTFLLLGRLGRLFIAAVRVAGIRRSIRLQLVGQMRDLFVHTTRRDLSERGKVFLFRESFDHCHDLESSLNVSEPTDDMLE